MEIWEFWLDQLVFLLHLFLWRERERVLDIRRGKTVSADCLLRQCQGQAEAEAGAEEPKSYRAVNQVVEGTVDRVERLQRTKGTEVAVFQQEKKHD